MAQTVQTEGRRPPVEVEVKCVDTDVHPYFQSPLELGEYVQEPWRTLEFSRRGRAPESITPPILHPVAVAMRKDAISPSGEKAGSDPDFVYKQLLEGMGVDVAILIPLLVRMNPDPELESALASGLNTWLADKWLSKHNWHGRFRGSIRVCSEDPRGAVNEIEKWAGHPYFVQVFMPTETPAPLGQPQYHPIYETAAKYGLPVALHAQTVAGARMLTPGGFTVYFYENFATVPLIYMAHVASLVFDGVFDKFPNLRIVLVEGGFTWLPPLVWRLETHWTHLRNEVPHLKRRPMEYVRDNIRVSTQPFEEPKEPGHLRYLIGKLGDQMLMFASDYPHHDADDPKWITPRLPKENRDRILKDNALDLYGLPRTRPVTAEPPNEGTGGTGMRSPAGQRTAEELFDI